MKKVILIIFIFITLFSEVKSQLRYEDSLRIEISRSKEDTNRVMILHELASLYAWSYPDSCILYAQEALKLSKKLNYINGEISSDWQLTQGFSGRGNYPKALQAGLNSLGISEKERDSINIIWSYANIGAVYFYSEDYSKALFYFNKLKLNYRIYQQFQRLFAGFLGEAYYRLNQFDSAWEYLQTSYNLDEKRKEQHWAVPSRYIGNLYASKNNLDSAFHYYRQAVRYSKAQLDLADVCIEITSLFQRINQRDSALFYANKALAVAQNSSFISQTAKSSELLTELYLANQNTDSASKYMEIMLSAKNGLYSQAKQNLSVNELLHEQELKQKESEYKNKTRTYILIGGLAALVLFLGFLYRNNRQKQKSNKVLEQTLINLRSTQTQLIQSEKMASLGELTAGIAHEIQNPLNFVNNFSEVNDELLKELKVEAAKGNFEEVKAIANDIESNSEKINHHGKRADAIVKSMLQHSRSSSGKKELTDINALADEYLRLAYHGLRAKDKSFNANFKTEFDNSISKINVVPQEIGRVFLNLINNAFYAVNEKYKQNISGYEPTVTVSTLNQSGKIKIKVSDNGNGIPQKILDKIFQPFFTTKPTGQGTGLGLSLSYDIITKGHGGELKVETKEGEGSMFIISLPA